MTSGDVPAGRYGGRGGGRGGDLPLGALGRRAGGPLLVVASTVCVQLGAAASVAVFAVLGPAATAGLRYALAAGLLLAAVRPRLRGRSRREWGGILLFGAVMVVMNLAFYLAIDRIALGTAVAIEFCGPLAVAAFASRSWRDGLWVLLAGTGVVLLVSPFGSGAASPAGIAFAALAGAGWAGYVLLSRHVGASTEGLEGLSLSVAAAAVLTLPLWVTSTGALSVRELGLLAASAAVGVALAFALELQALRILSAHAVSVLLSLEPAVALVVGLALLSQHAGVAELAGIACVVAAGVAVSARPAPPLL